MSSPRLVQSESCLVRELTSPRVGVSASCPVTVALVRQAFFESLDLDLEGEPDLLLLVQFGSQVVEALLVRALEIFEIAAQLLQPGVDVAGVVGMRRSVYASP